jgi:hypothetical protein
LDRLIVGIAEGSDEKSGNETVAGRTFTVSEVQGHVQPRRACFKEWSRWRIVREIHLDIETRSYTGSKNPTHSWGSRFSELMRRQRRTSKEAR